jgi:chemotaxis signal transduction protein
MQHLTFRVKNCKLVLAVNQIQEIVHSYKLTPLPKTPVELSGVINLRGYYLPVLSLWRRIQQENDDKSNHSTNVIALETHKCILVTEAMYEEQAWRLGLEVDEVHDCILIDETSWRAPPVRGNKIAPEYLSAMVNLEGETYHKLNLEAIIDPDDILERYQNGATHIHESNRHSPRTAG